MHFLHVHHVLTDGSIEMSCGEAIVSRLEWRDLRFDNEMQTMALCLPDPLNARQNVKSA